MLRLGVNVDHVATVRQARYRDAVRGAVPEPSPAGFAALAQKAGAHGITAHLREDRRHIQDSDLKEISALVKLPLNLEMADTPEMRRIASRLRPANACIVPESRQEVTTEGGLDVAGHRKSLETLCTEFAAKKIVVSLFIDPDLSQVAAAHSVGAPFIELHTGQFALCKGRQQIVQVKRLQRAAELAHSLGIRVNAGHGINYENVKALFDVPHLYELNIGHTLVSRAFTVGGEKAVKEMLLAMRGYKG